MKNPTEKAVVGFKPFVRETRSEGNGLVGCFESEQVVERKLGYCNVATSFGEMEVVVASILEDKEEKPEGVECSDEL